MKFLLFLSLLLVSDDLFAAKRDFRGLFGSYRREKFTENEGRSSDFGVDLKLSTLIPVTSVVKSTEDGTTFSDLYYATSFNYELGFFYTLSYNWELYFDIGYMSYDTRKENTVRAIPTLPKFHVFEMEVIPLILGTKYRLSTDDIVPYVGLGVGLSYVHRKVSYDYDTRAGENRFLNAFTAQAQVGAEFYFTPRAGLRLEVSAFYIALPSSVFSQGSATAGNYPHVAYQSNPISVRYASGIFILF